jgi:hypothetical protein
MKVSLLVFAVLTSACSKSSTSAVEAGVSEASSEAGVVEEGGSGVDGGDGGFDAGSCTCSPGGACDSFGCPPNYNGSAFATWCQTVQSGARGNVVSMKTCGSLLLITYALDGGCDHGYAVEQPSGNLVATLDECNGAPQTCALLTPNGCLPQCCLDKSCALGIPSLCPAWEPEGGSVGDAAGE